MNRFVFFIFVFFVSAFASCSSKKEAIRVEMDKSIRDQINMILDSRKKNSNNSIDVSFINGKVRIHEVEYYEKPDSVTNEPVVKKETETFIDFERKDTSSVDIFDSDSSYIIFTRDSVHNYTGDFMNEEQKEETSFMKYIYKSLIALSVLLSILFLFLFFRKKFM